MLSINMFLELFGSFADLHSKSPRRPAPFRGAGGIGYTPRILLLHTECIYPLKARLQSKGIKSAKRHLKKLSGRAARFSKDVNHCISKGIVAKAKDTLRSIALEDLQGIRDRVTVRKAQRRSLQVEMSSDVFNVAMLGLRTTSQQ